jgi:hypothetical protein
MLQRLNFRPKEEGVVIMPSSGRAGRSGHPIGGLRGILAYPQILILPRPEKYHNSLRNPCSVRRQLGSPAEHLGPLGYVASESVSRKCREFPGKASLASVTYAGHPTFRCYKKLNDAHVLLVSFSRYPACLAVTCLLFL